MKENLDQSNEQVWNFKKETGNAKQSARLKTTESGSLAGEVIRLKKYAAESEKERSRLKKDVVYLVN